MTLDRDQARRLPKVLLHDHIDGGLRPATVLELADEVGHRLPAADERSLADWFHAGADRKDLVAYLETFVHTVAVMQASAGIERVSYECGADLAADGVVYAEVRHAAELSTARGLSIDAVLEAITAGLARAQRDHGIVLRFIAVAIRSEGRSLEAAEAAVRWRDAGVVAFDLAGPEAGYPAEDHLAACEAALAGGLGLTLHAGEAHGLSSIRSALACGATRLGHGVRIMDDVQPDGALGALAQRVVDERIALEVCPSSNVHTGAAASVGSHPVQRLRELGFAVTVNTDNRLMSATSMTEEFVRCSEAFGWTRDDVGDITSCALDAAFCDEDTRDAVRTRLALP